MGIITFAGSDLGSLLCCGLVLGIPLFLWWNSYKQGELRRQKLAEAEGAYRNALEHLKRNPNDPNLKQTTLNLGRNYSVISRQGKVAIYDEMAIMNDINAATASAAQNQFIQTPQYQQPPAIQPSPFQQSPTNQLSLEDRLIKLIDLKNKGLINENEYEQRRQKLLDEV